MANRRMFSNRIANSARFLQMPAESQLLYFHMILRADDDGVVESYPLMKLLGMASDNFKVLLAKGFIRQLNEDQVVVITDWLEHNVIRADRKTDSIYKYLLPDTIKTIEAKPRSDVGDNSKRISGQSTDGIGKVRLGKVRLGKVSTIGLDKPTVSRKKQSFKQDDYVKVADAYQALKGLTLVGNEFLPVQQAVKSMFMSKRTPDQIIEFMTWLKEKAESDDKKWVWTKNWTINTVKIKLPEHIAGLLEEKEEAKIPYYAKGYIK